MGKKRKKNKRRSRKDKTTQHVWRAARDRYGIHLAKKDMRNIIALIQPNIEKGQHVSETNSIHVVTYRNTTMAFLYDDYRKQLLTVLPMDDWKRLRNTNETEGTFYG